MFCLAIYIIVHIYSSLEVEPLLVGIHLKCVCRDKCRDFVAIKTQRLFFSWPPKQIRKNKLLTYLSRETAVNKTKKEGKKRFCRSVKSLLMILMETSNSKEMHAETHNKELTMQCKNVNDS